MTHITSRWALQYGLPDPAMAAADITSADGRTSSSAAHGLDVVALALSYGREQGSAARLAIETSWSAARPRRTVHAVMSLSEQVEAICRTSSLACAELSAAIATAHADVGTAYAAADRAISTMDLERDEWAIDVDDALSVERARSTLVWNLNAALASIGRSLNTAAARAASAMVDDPIAMVPQSTVNAATTEHRTNLALLRADLRAPTGRRQRFALAVERALLQARADGYPAQLLHYDSNNPSNQGGVAIAIGDVAQAASVAVLVPGVGNSPVHIANNFDLAHALNAATDRASGAADSSATVLWFAYDIPLSWRTDGAIDTPYRTARGALTDSLRAVDATEAAAAGMSLAGFVHGLRPLMRGGANLSLIGHSYGSTTVAQAARRLDETAGVDNILLLGSPGVGYGVVTADDFHAVDADHVFSLNFPADPVPVVGGSGMIAALNPVGRIARKWVFGSDPGPFGRNPALADFGATVIDAPSNVPVDAALDFDQHALSNYLSGSSLTAISAVTAARYRQVPHRPPRPSTIQPPP